TFFNYQYIIDAFVVNKEDNTVTTTKDTATKDGGIAIDIVQATLKNVRFRFHDESGGTDFALHLNDLLLRPNNIDLNTLDFDIEAFNINGLKTSLTLTESILPPSPTDTTASAAFKLKV